MIISIEITGELLDELNETIAEVNREPNSTQITIEGYCQNIVTGWIENRMRGEYIHASRNDSLDSLKQIFGPVAALRRARKGRQQ